MEGDEIFEASQVLGLPPVPPLNVGIAIDGNRKSKYVVVWALQKFVLEEKVVFKLLHVRPKIKTVPTPSKQFVCNDPKTPVGNSIPISQVRDDVALAYKKEIEWQQIQMLLPYKRICNQKKVEADIIVIESDDIANAIAEEVAKSNINKLVIGASSRGMFRRSKANNLSSRISVSAPSSCTVYAVSKGKLESIRPSDIETNGSTRDDSSIASESTNYASSFFSSSATDATSVVAPQSLSHSPSLAMQRFQALSTINQGHFHARGFSVDSNSTVSQSLEIDDAATQRSSPSSSESGHEVSLTSSLKLLSYDNSSWVSDQASTSDAFSEFSSSENQASINLELEKLRIELRHVRGIYAMAQNESIDASRKLNDLHKHRTDEAKKFKEMSEKEEEAKLLAEQEKENFEAAEREAENLRHLAEREASHRREAEMMADREAKEKEKLDKALKGNVQQYQSFSWEEITSATSSFSEELKIGMGAYGTVYRCSLHHTTAAVKVLHSNDNPNAKQFKKEIEILSTIRHPHLLILLGACTDHGCLVYEYMENGSLEDRLQRVNSTPAIPWFERFRIAWEVASALVFLHNAKPNPIIHRDLKPANILLDHNLVSKIGDVGLSTMLHSDPSSVSTTFKDTGPVGTLCYIDPEYQRTGLISPKSDVYAFGMVILQLLTAKPAIALAHVMETAVEEDCLQEVLDKAAGNWPAEETKELAMLGLSCAELRRKDRPALKDQVLPTLERLKEAVKRNRHPVSNTELAPPSHFICPVLKDVMNDPCVAADGYTYDRNAIMRWLEEKNTSPMTNLPLPNKNLLPNYTLLSAIVQWKTRNQ